MGVCDKKIFIYFCSMKRYLRAILPMMLLLALLLACSRGNQMREHNRFRVATDTKNILRLTIGA